MRRIRGGSPHVFGCFYDYRSVCADYAAPPDLLDRLDTVVDVQKLLANSLGPCRVRACEELVLFAGGALDGGAPTHYFVKLLVDGRLKPKVQLYAQCKLGRYGEDGLVEFTELPPTPFDISMVVGPCRMDATRRDGVFSSTQLQTSREVALALSQTCLAWRLHPLVYEMSENTLLDTRVLGVGEAFILKGRSRRPPQKATAAAWPAEFDIQDPVLFGATGKTIGGAAATAAAVDPIASLVEAMGSSDDDLRSMASDGSAAEAASEGSGPEVVDDALGPPTAEAEAPPSLDELVAASAMDIAGYTTCSLPPFIDLGRVGRYTEFGGGSMAMRCYAHAKCSVTRSTRRWGRTAMLRWLLAGTWEPDATPERKEVLRAEHARLASTMLPPLVAASSAGAASSHGD